MPSNFFCTKVIAEMVKTLSLPTRHGSQVEAELMQCESAILEKNCMGTLQPRSEGPPLAVVGRLRKGIHGGGFCSNSGSGLRECWENRLETNFPARGAHCWVVHPRLGCV